MTYVPASRLRDQHLGQLNLQAERDFPRALFVCSGGMLRSATAAQVMAHYGWNTRAAGTYNVAIQQVTPTVLRWADLIFCLETQHVEEIENMFPDVYREIKNKIRIMNISDNYVFRKSELILFILRFFGIEETQESISKLFEEPKERAKKMLSRFIMEDEQ